MALTKVSGNVIQQPFNVGVVTAAQTANAQIQVHHAAHGPGGYLMATEIKQ